MTRLYVWLCWMVKSSAFPWEHPLHFQPSTSLCLIKQSKLCPKKLTMLGGAPTGHWWQVVAHLGTSMLALICPWHRAFTAKNFSPFYLCCHMCIAAAGTFIPGSQPMSQVPLDLLQRLMLNRMILQSPASAAYSLLIKSKQQKFSWFRNNWKLDNKWDMGCLNRKQCQQSLYLENTQIQSLP